MASDGQGGRAGGAENLVRAGTALKRGQSDAPILLVGDEKVYKLGHLVKQGGSYKSWRRRFFVLSQTSLHYYKHRKDFDRGALPVKSISLDSVRVLVDNAHKRKWRSSCA